jgi:hypothetical protein
MTEGPYQIRNEHAPRTTRQAPESDQATYQPTPEEEKAVETVMKLLDRAKKHRARYDEKWLDHYRMFRGRQWPDQRPSYRSSEVINLVFQAVQSQVPLLTDSRPRIAFLPKDPTDRELAEILNDLIESDWERGAWLMTLTEVLYDAEFYGIGYSYEGYDGEANQKAGAACYESIDPFECFPDPDARNVNGKDSTFFIRAYPKNIDKLKAEYPELAPFLKADLGEVQADDRTQLAPAKIRTPVNQKMTPDTGSYQQYPAKESLGLVIEAWIKDPEVVELEVEEQDETGATRIVYEQRKRWPNGRWIMMQNKVILRDQDIPFDDGEFPFSRHVNYILPREFYGISEVENLSSPQRLFNKFVNYAVDVMALMGNPIWIAPTSSGIDPETIFNRPGLVLETEDDGAGVRRVEGAQLQPFIMQMIEKLKTWFDDVAGSTDITRGVNPGGVTAASAISQLQETGLTRIRQKARNMDAYLRSVAGHWVSRVLQFYSVERVHRVTNKDGVQKYFRFKVGTNDNGQKVASVTPYEPWGAAGERKEFIVQAEFDIDVQTGSSLPFAKADKEQRSYQLFDRGIIDEEEVLKNLDYPNAEAVLDRVRKRKAAEAEAAAQQQQQAAGGR